MYNFISLLCCFSQCGILIFIIWENQKGGNVQNQILPFFKMYLNVFFPFLWVLSRVLMTCCKGKSAHFVQLKITIDMFLWFISATYLIDNCILIIHCLSLNYRCRIHTRYTTGELLPIIVPFCAPDLEKKIYPLHWNTRIPNTWR